MIIFCILSTIREDWKKHQRSISCLVSVSRGDLILTCVSKQFEVQGSLECLIIRNFQEYSPMWQVTGVDCKNRLSKRRLIARPMEVQIFHLHHFTLNVLKFFLSCHTKASVHKSLCSRIRLLQFLHDFPLL